MPMQDSFILHSYENQGPAGFLEKKLSPFEILVVSENQQLTSVLCILRQQNCL